MKADYAMNAEFYEVLFGMVEGEISAVFAYRPGDDRAQQALWSEMPAAANDKLSW